MSHLGSNIHVVAAFLSVISLHLSCQTLGFRENQEKEAKIQDLINTKLDLVKGQLDKGQADEAWDALRPMLQTYPENAHILNMAGLVHLALSNQDRALRLFQHAFQIEPLPAIALNLSSAYITGGSYKAARELLKKTLLSEKKYPYRERLWHNLALTYEKEKKYTQATKFYEKALRENPSYYLSTLQLATALKMQQNTQKSLQYFQKALKLCPTCYPPVNELATYYINQDQADKAMELLRTFMKNKESSPDLKNQAKSLLDLAQSVKSRQNTGVRLQ